MAMRRSVIRLVQVAMMWALIPAPTTRGQEPGQFEVASIRPNDSGAAQMVVGPRNGRFRASNVTAQFLVEWTYELREFRIICPHRLLISTHRFSVLGPW